MTAPATPFGLDATGVSAVPNGVEIATLALMQPTAAKEDGRTCRKCGEWKPREAYHRDPGYSLKMRAKCKECVAKMRHAKYEQQKQDPVWLAKTHEYARRLYHGDARRKKNIALKNDHGVTVEQYEAMYEKQQGRCALCDGQCPSGQHLSIDHCHATGTIRGLLCKPCNMALGLFYDDPSRLQRAIEYLLSTGTAKSAAA